MASLQRIQAKNMKCVRIVFFPPRGPVRADASPCMVRMDDDTADTLRDIKLLARSKWDLSWFATLRSVYREIGCPETSVSNHQSTLRNNLTLSKLSALLYTHPTAQGSLVGM